MESLGSKGGTPSPKPPPLKPASSAENVEAIAAGVVNGAGVIVPIAGFLLALPARVRSLSPRRFRVGTAEAGNNWPSAGQEAG